MPFKGSHPGILLTTVGLDANNRVYLVVYVVVEAKNKATRKWFYENLRDDLKISDPIE